MYYYQLAASHNNGMKASKLGFYASTQLLSCYYENTCNLKIHVSQTIYVEGRIECSCSFYADNNYQVYYPRRLKGALKEFAIDVVKANESRGFLSKSALEDLLEPHPGNFWQPFMPKDCDPILIPAQ